MSTERIVVIEEHHEVPEGIVVSEPERVTVAVVALPFPFRRLPSEHVGKCLIDVHEICLLSYLDKSELESPTGAIAKRTASSRPASRMAPNRVARRHPTPSETFGGAWHRSPAMRRDQPFRKITEGDRAISVAFDFLPNLRSVAETECASSPKCAFRMT
jgi:hypothetical protein